MKQDDDPARTLRRWLPHALLLSLLALAIWLLIAVFAPLLEPLMLAAAITVLTYRVLFIPVDRFIAKILPILGGMARAQLSGIAACSILVGMLVLPMLLLLLTSIGSIEGVGKLSLGVWQQSPEHVERLISLLMSQVDWVQRVFPKIPIDKDWIRSELNTFVLQISDFAPNVLVFLFKGSGGMMVQAVLVLIALAFFYARGPELARRLLTYTPLSEEQVEKLFNLQRRTVLRLLSDTLATALAKGCALALAAWAVAGLPFLPIAIVGSFVCLVPLIGATVVWLPLVSLLWSQEKLVAAGILAVLSLAAMVGIGALRHRLGKHLYDQGSWMSFMLFLAVVGGLIAFGLKGFVIGPILVVITATLGRFWLPLYGIGVSNAEDERSL